MAATQSTILSVVSILFLLLMRWYQGARNYQNMSKGVSVHRTEIKSPTADMCRWCFPFSERLS